MSKFILLPQQSGYSSPTESAIVEDLGLTVSEVSGSSTIALI